jgi:hypothetical protein
LRYAYSIISMWIETCLYPNMYVDFKSIYSNMEKTKLFIESPYYAVHLQKGFFAASNHMVTHHSNHQINPNKQPKNTYASKTHAGRPTIKAPENHCQTHAGCGSEPTPAMDLARQTHNQSTREPLPNPHRQWVWTHAVTRRTTVTRLRTHRYSSKFASKLDSNA